MTRENGHYRRLLASLLLASWACTAQAKPLNLRRVGQPMQTPGPLPASAVIMVWASWCVPCRAELGRFAAMRDAERPLRAMTLALDPGSKAAAGLSAAGVGLKDAYFTDSPPGAVLASLGGTPARLPLALATDSSGRICGIRHGLLGSDQLRAWAASCSK